MDSFGLLPSHRLVAELGLGAPRHSRGAVRVVELDADLVDGVRPRGENLRVLQQDIGLALVACRRAGVEQSGDLEIARQPLGGNCRNRVAEPGAQPVRHGVADEHIVAT